MLKLLLLCLFSVGTLYAQSEHLFYYSYKDGLPFLRVFSCVQDKNGFLWLGTDNGLSRFDGNHFETFTYSDGLPDNEIIEVLADDKGGIWGRTTSRQLFYFKDRKCYKTFEHGIENVQFYDIVSDAKGENIYAFQDKSSFIVYKLAYGAINKVRTFNQKSAIVNARWINKDTFAVFYGFQVQYFDKNYQSLGEQTLNLHYLSHTYSLTFFDFDSIAFLNMRMVNGHDSLFLIRNGHSTPYKIIKKWHISKHILNINRLDNQFYLSFSDGGYIVTDGKTANIDTLKPYYKQHVIGNIYPDKEKNIWLCTEGLLFKPIFQRYIIGKKEGLDEEELYAVYVDDSNHIWIGSRLGDVYKYDGKKMIRFHGTHTRQNERVLNIIQHPEHKEIMFASDLGVWGIRKNTLHNYYLGATKNLLLSRNKQDLYWGSASFWGKRNVLLPAPKTDSINRHKAFGLAEAPDGKIWMGTDMGLFVYDGQSAVEISQNIAPDLLTKIYRIAFSKDSTLWVATRLNGLIAIKHNQIQVVIQEKNGLLGNNCSALHIDEADNVWVGTYHGVNKIGYHYAQNGKLSYTIESFTTARGLVNNIVNGIFVKDKKVYVATAAGLSIFEDNQYTSANKGTFITRIQIAGRDTSIVPYVQLQHNENQLDIAFNTICFGCEGNMDFFYRLLPDNHKWSMTKERNLSFNGLAPGIYTLEVYSTANPASIATLQIEIVPAWWQTKVFLLLMLVLAGGIVYFIAQKVSQYQQKKEQEKQQIQNKIRELEISALRSQMNPHFIFNTLTSLQYYINMGEGETANVVITKFARLIRKTLDISQTAHITIAEEIEYLNNYLYLEKIRFKDKFTYEIICDVSVASNKQKIPSLVLQPFVENAIRHGIKHKTTQGGWVKVHFYMQDSITFVCEIEDNGVGRVAAKALKEKQTIQTYDSKGMMLSMSRIELLKSVKQQDASIQIIDKQDEAGNASGTLIRIVFIENSNIDLI